ncbi:hypothetical protein HYDPIDRAFT_42842 [Hydnomerulius pinastri MD-312]|uniref:Uncharacterized protein n=1 Tax=Hydnomerulius pinastri MD-312 TaxID=994086 RepID=A0A0C9VTH4_9AGAM|nr:hypothetical protein HYDPIDRAFT_42842 [Hydnomerulius pinastri MD-312]
MAETVALPFQRGAYSTPLRAAFGSAAFSNRQEEFKRPFSQLLPSSPIQLTGGNLQPSDVTIGDKDVGGDPMDDSSPSSFSDPRPTISHGPSGIMGDDRLPIWSRFNSNIASQSPSTGSPQDGLNHGSMQNGRTQASDRYEHGEDDDKKDHKSSFVPRSVT